MKPYISLDVETTSIDPEEGQVLEIGAVIDDWETPVENLPRFQCYVLPEGCIYGNPFALSMHPKILRRIATAAVGYNYHSENDVALEFRRWVLTENGPIQKKLTMAGKNFGSFDRQFLRRLPRWEELVPMQHRSIDPGNLYWEPCIDEGLPDLKTCMDRANIPGPVPHTAVEDALIVVKLIRKWANR